MFKESTNDYNKLGEIDLVHDNTSSFLQAKDGEELSFVNKKILKKAQESRKQFDQKNKDQIRNLMRKQKEKKRSGEIGIDKT